MELGRSGGVRGVRTDHTNTHRHKLSRDLVLHDIRKSTFQKYWNFNVLEMVFETIHFVPGLSRTPLLFLLRYLTNIFVRRYFQTIEMVFKTFHFVPGLSRAPLLFILRYFTNMFFPKVFPRKIKIGN